MTDELSAEARRAIEQLAALALAAAEMLPDTYSYRVELVRLAADVLEHIDMKPGWSDAIIHEHAVQLDRALMRKPGVE